MAYVPISLSVPQYSVPNPSATTDGGYGVLRLYAADTDTVTFFYTDETGAIALNSVQLNSNGVAVHLGETFLPHVDDSEDYKLAFYATQADADSDNLSAAIWWQDNITPITKYPVGVEQLNTGTDASASTFWRGDGTWAAPPASGISEIVEDTTPQLGGQLDVNGFAIGNGTEELITFNEASTAVNHIKVSNAASGGYPYIVADGDDTNIDLGIDSKGSGSVVIYCDLAISGGFITIDGANVVTVNATQTLTGKTLTTPTITLKQSTGPTPTAEGDIQWDTDDNKIVIGDGSGQKVFVPTASFSGDATVSTGGAVTLTDAPAMVFLEAKTASNSATIDFDSATTGVLDGTYDEYVVRLLNVVPATDAASLWVRTSSDGGATFDSGASDYRYRIGTATTAAQIVIAASVGSDTNETGVSGEYKIFQPGLAQYTDMQASVMFIDSIGDPTLGNNSHVNARRLAAEDVTGIQFLFSSGNIESGEFAIYGIKRS